MAAPTFIQEAETTWSAVSTSPKTTASFGVVAGDILVAAAGSEDDGQTLGPASGGSLTWTTQQHVQAASYCEAFAATAVVDVDKSMTVSMPCANVAGTKAYGVNALTFRGSDGVGASAKTNAAGAPSLAIVTTQDNSAIVVCVTDWNAVDGLLRTWRTVNGITPDIVSGELTYFRDSVRYTVYIAYYSDAGTAGAKTVGLSAPAGQAYAIVAAEIKGSGGAASVPPILVMPPMRATRR